MNTILITGIIFGLLVTAVWVGAVLRRRLPAHHLSTDTKDTVKLAMGLVGTMSALLLGLLVSSAKGSYDATRDQVIQMAAKAALLDRMLANYGPEAKEVHEQFQAGLATVIRQIWPESGGASTLLRPDMQVGNKIYAALQSLPTKDDAHRALKGRADDVAMELGELRMLLQAESVSSISRPLLVMVVCWLLVIFLSFSLLAPSNATANAALGMAALSVAGAIFLILELDRPFEGLVRISRQPMVNALGQISR